MKSIRTAACLLLAGAAALSGCSGEAGNAEESAGVVPGAPAAQAEQQTQTIPAAPDYGDVLGTVQIEVTNRDGYMASVQATIHGVTMLSSVDELPSWCPGSFTPGTKETTLFEASSILMQAVESTVRLAPHEGFPEPKDWSPLVSVGMSSIERVMKEGANSSVSLYSGYGECAASSGAGPEPALTDAGYENIFIDLKDGRGTPAQPLPTTVEEVPFTQHPEFYLDVEDGETCSIQPSDEFIFVGHEDYNSPERNNGSCAFILTPKARA